MAIGASDYLQLNSTAAKITIANAVNITPAMPKPAPEDWTGELYAVCGMAAFLARALGFPCRVE
jgi:hypothetical protein